MGMGGLHTVALPALMLVAWAKSLPHYGPCHGWGWGSGREMFHRGTSGRAVETERGLLCWAEVRGRGVKTGPGGPPHPHPTLPAEADCLRDAQEGREGRKGALVHQPCPCPLRGPAPRGQQPGL